jgi:type IV pilus assembly protein PilM
MVAAPSAKSLGVLTAGKRKKAVVGLEIEAGSIAATEVRANGHPEVVGHGVAPLDPGVFREGEASDVDALAAALKALFAEHKLSKGVRLGIGNQRIAVRTLDLPRIEKPAELETAIRFQASEQVPMPLDEAVLDWQVVGNGTGPSGEPRISVVVVAARRETVEALLSALRKADLRPAGIDLSAFGMIRALTGDDGTPSPEAPATARLLCNLGDVVNLAVARGSVCLFTRIAPFGVEGIAQQLAERLSLTLEHARQWLVHVGLERPVEQIEGDPELVAAVRTAAAGGASRLADEMRRSLEFYGAQDGAIAVDGIVACGPGTTIPGLVAALESNLGRPVTVGRPEGLAGLDPVAGARLVVPFGLALEE